MLGGKCRGCGDRISIQYPIVELLVGLMWLGSYLIFGPTLTALRVAVFATVMAGIAITDARHFLIPDGFTVFGLFWQLATALLALYVGDSGPFVRPWEAFIGLCVGAGAISVVGWLGEVWLKRPAMGFGDVTLMAVVGAAVGAERAFLTIFLAAVIAPIVLLAVVYPLSARGMTHDRGQTELPLDAATSWRRRELPFGVFLAPAAVCALLWGDAIIGWYLSVSGL
jgi:leader peptidase (prepilin peptidase)/N-methyltransferase